MLSTSIHKIACCCSGDELLLKHGTWEASGYVIRLHEVTEEVALELRAGRACKAAPTDTTAGFKVECVWNGTTFERMQRALKKLAVNNKSTAQVIYHKYVKQEADQHMGLPFGIDHWWACFARWWLCSFQAGSGLHVYTSMRHKHHMRPPGF